MPRLKTTVDKALHQVQRGRRRITARDFNMEVRDRVRTHLGPDPADSERLLGISIRDVIKWRYGSLR